ncbi:hypothetical protein ACW5XW_13590 [Aeromonas piscicola]|jgi:hypothetical protein|uniref:Uncharacterized protein n=1 Tax=Aeromonas piscicola TaxID=600645 RepID=A0ABT7QBA1_9GAMM|nr:hypothetical protein [Aeromonas piscicola]MDM5130924.1 hypothetical protein [Aeromonas piscicola]
MQRSLPKIDMFTFGPCPFLYDVRVNQSLAGEGIREALKEGND